MSTPNATGSPFIIVPPPPLPSALPAATAAVSSVPSASVPSPTVPPRIDSASRKRTLVSDVSDRLKKLAEEGGPSPTRDADRTAAAFASTDGNPLQKKRRISPSKSAQSASASSSMSNEKLAAVALIVRQLIPLWEARHKMSAQSLGERVVSVSSAAATEPPQAASARQPQHDDAQLKQEIAEKESKLFASLSGINLADTRSTAVLLFENVLRFTDEVLFAYLLDVGFELDKNNEETLDLMLRLAANPKLMYLALKAHSRVLFPLEPNADAARVTARTAKCEQLHTRLWEMAVRHSDTSFADMLIAARVPLVLSVELRSYVVQSGSVVLVQTLLAAGFVVETAAEAGAADRSYTLLLCALHAGRKDIAIVLKPSYQNFDPTDRVLEDGLQVAAERQNLQMLEFLLESGVVDEGYALAEAVLVKFREGIALLTTYPACTEGAIHCYLSICSNFVEFSEDHQNDLRICLNAGADINWLVNGATFAMRALRMRTQADGEPWDLLPIIRMIRWFKSNNGDLTLHGDDTRNILSEAVNGKQEEILIVLLELLADVAMKDKSDCLNEAFIDAILSKRSVYTLLKAQGANAYDDALIALLSHISPESPNRANFLKARVASLKAWGANPDMSYEDGASAMLSALKDGERDLAVGLIEVGTDITVCNADGFGLLTHLIVYGINQRFSNAKIATMIEGALTALQGDNGTSHAAIDDLFAAQILLVARGFGQSHAQLVTTVSGLQHRVLPNATRPYRILPMLWRERGDSQALQAFVNGDWGAEIETAYTNITSEFEPTVFVPNSSKFTKSLSTSSSIRPAINETMRQELVRWRCSMRSESVATEFTVTKIINNALEFLQADGRKQEALAWMSDRWMGDWQDYNYDQTLEDLREALDSELTKHRDETFSSATSNEAKAKLSADVWAQLQPLAANPPTEQAASIAIDSFENRITGVLTQDGKVGDKFDPIIDILEEAAEASRRKAFAASRLDANGRLGRTDVRELLREWGLILPLLPLPREPEEKTFRSLRQIVAIIPPPPAVAS